MPIELATLPIPLGVTYPIKKSPRYVTVTQATSNNLRAVSFSVTPTPAYEWELTFDHLRDQGLQPATQNAYNSSSGLTPDFFALFDFYNQMQGSNGRFLFDPAANNPPLEDTWVTQATAGTLVNGYSATTDGVTTSFQLYRSSSVTGTLLPAESVDALSALTPSPGIYLNGSLVSPSLYTISQFPLVVTFTTAPTAGQALSWAGYYAYCCQFSDDSLEFDQFLSMLWDLGSLKLSQVPLS